MLINGDVRKEYYLRGATWTANGNQPTGVFGIGNGNEVGTSRLANSALETYRQGINCFGCHTSNTVNVSAVWSKIDPLF